MEYTIIRVYRVPATSQREATDRFAEAVEFGVERDFHVKDRVKAGEEPRGLPMGVPASWWTLVKRQLFG